MSLRRDCIGRNAVNRFLNDPAPDFDSVETVLDFSMHSVEPQAFSRLPESVCRRLRAPDVYEVEMHNFLKYVILQVALTFPADFQPARLAVDLLREFLKGGKPHEPVELMQTLNGEAVVAAQSATETLQSCLRLMHAQTGKLQQQIQETKRTTQAQLAEYLASCGLVICGFTLQTVFVRGEPPTREQLDGFSLNSNSEPISCVLELNRAPGVEGRRIEEPERQMALRAVVLKWMNGIGVAASHVNWEPLSKEVLVASTTRSFLVGSGLDVQILNIVRLFDQVLWIHTDPTSIPLQEKSVQIWSPQHWQRNDFKIPPNTEIVIFSMMASVLHELDVSAAQLLEPIGCCCLVTDFILSPALAPYTTPGSVFPVFACEPVHEYVHFHESRSSIQHVKTQAMAEAKTCKDRHCLIISDKQEPADGRRLDGDPRVSTWNPFTGPLSMALRRKTFEVITDVIVDLKFSDSAEQGNLQLFVLAMDGAFTFTLSLSAFHIFWPCHEMRRFSLTLAALLSWRPVYCNRHNCISPVNTMPRKVATATRKRKLEDISRTRQRSDALSLTAQELFATQDFELIASITLLRKILLTAKVKEADFLRADGATRYEFALCEQECSNLFRWMRQFDALNDDTCPANPDIQTRPACMLKRVALAFARICERIPNSKPTVYAFYLNSAVC